MDAEADGGGWDGYIERMRDRGFIGPLLSGGTIDKTYGAFDFSMSRGDGAIL